MPRLPLPLPDRVPVVVVAVVFLLHLEGVSHGDKDVDRGRVVIVDVDNGLLRSETNKHDKLHCSCDQSNRSKHKIDR